MFRAVPTLRHNIDAFGWHAYAPDAAAAVARLRTVRAILRREGAPDVPIYITEFGWPTAGSRSISEAKRAQDLSTFVHLVASSGCGVGLISAYAWLTKEEDPTNRENWYGLANFDGTLKPAALSYAAAVRETADTAEASGC